MAKVLLVEDDNNLREIYQARLLAEGYEIVAAQDGEEALVSAKKEHPDLIISDVMMPRISGFEMLDILRNTEELKATKVIMLTALGQSEDQSRASSLGADKYLVKSQVTLEDIVKSAKELLGEAPADAAPGASANPVESPNVAVPVAQPAPDPLDRPVPAPATATAAASEVTTAQPVSPAASVSTAAVVPPIEQIAVTAVAPVSAPAVPTTAAALPVPAAIAVPVASEQVATSIQATTVTPAPTQISAAVSAPESQAGSTQPVVTTAATAVPATASNDSTASTASSQPTAITDSVAATTTPTMPVQSPATAVPVTPDPSVIATVPAAPAVAPDAAQIDAGALSLAAEEKAIQDQIAGFAKQPGVDPTEAAPQSSEEAAKEANDEAVLVNAVHQLNGEVAVAATAPVTPTAAAPAPADNPVVAVTPTPEAVEPLAQPPITTQAAPEAVAVQPAPGEAPHSLASGPDQTRENVTVAGKKVIQPLNSTLNSGPNLEALLAKEEAKEGFDSSGAVQIQPVIGGAAGPDSSQTSSHSGLDPTIVSL